MAGSRVDISIQHVPVVVERVEVVGLFPVRVSDEADLNRFRHVRAAESAMHLPVFAGNLIQRNDVRPDPGGLHIHDAGVLT